MSEALTRTAIEATAQKSLLDVLTRYEKHIKAMIPTFMDGRRFAYLALTQIRTNPNLAGCSPASFLNSVMLASQMGLEIRRDSAYLVPFGRECTLMIDYKGKLDLARRSGKVGGIQAVTVRELDDFDWSYDINGVRFHHRPARQGKLISEASERGPIVGVYAFAQILGQGMQFREPMSLAEIDRIRKRSRAGVNFMSIQEIFDAQKLTEDGKQAIWQTWEFRDKRRQPWVCDFEAMAQKTALHALCKGLPLSPEAQLSQEVDDGFDGGKQPNILADIVDVDPVDNQPMLDDGSVEEQERVMDEKLAKAGQTLDSRKPSASTLSQINGFKKTLGDEKWFTVLGNACYENVNQIENEGKARAVRQAMREAGDGA